MNVSAFGVVHKSQYLKGVYKPITQSYGGRTFPDMDVVTSLRARLKGVPMFHGGNKGRVRRLAQGKSVDVRNPDGDGPKNALFMTPSKKMAEGYATAGRTPENFARQGGYAMNKHLTSRGGAGKVAQFNMKGVWPKSVEGNGTKVGYDLADAKGRVVNVTGKKPHRAGDAARRMASTSERDAGILADRAALRAKMKEDPTLRGRLKHIPGSVDTDTYRLSLRATDPLSRQTQKVERSHATRWGGMSSGPKMRRPKWKLRRSLFKDTDTQLTVPVTR